MESQFTILLRCRTIQGFENFGHFELGCSRTFAYAVFSELHGTTDAGEADSLTMELVEARAGLPINLKIISCTLDQLAANCRLLTKEIFKEVNLG
jgi:hypothetical protein